MILRHLQMDTTRRGTPRKFWYEGIRESMNHLDLPSKKQLLFPKVVNKPNVSIISL